MLDNLRPVSPKPGHVERVRTPSCPQGSTEDEEPVAFRQRFLKINVRHITDGQGVVSGVLLVTPNAVMFDPNVSDALVIEHGPEAYGVIAPMEFVVNAAIYTDIAHMRVGHVEGTAGEKPEIYYPKTEHHDQSDQNDSLMVKDETFPELGKCVHNLMFLIGFLKYLVGNSTPVLQYYSIVYLLLVILTVAVLFICKLMYCTVLYYFLAN